MFKRIKWFKKEVEPSGILEKKEESTVRQQQLTKLDLTHRCVENAAMGRTVYLFPVSMKESGGSKWGYINAKGEFVLRPVYDHAGDFQANGLAIVRLNGLSGVIDLNGYFIVSPKYDTIHPFSEGRATIIDRQGFKVIDENGKELTSRAYSFIGDYKEGRAVFSIRNQKGKNLYGYLNKRGKEVLPPVYESAGDFKEGKAIVKLEEGSYALINLTGKVLQTYYFMFVGDYSDGLLAFQKGSGDKFGYMDEEGNIKIQPRFTWAQPFQENCAIVTVADGDHDNYGLIDRQGQYIIKPQYQQLFHLGEGRVSIGKAVDPAKPYIRSLCALGDTNGHILTGFIYNGITKFEDGAASAYNDRSTFFIDEQGTRIACLPIVSGSGELHFEKTLIKGEIDFRLFYFKRNGEQVWKQNTVISLNETYAVIEQKYKPNKDFLIYYPQITGMFDQKTQAKINQLLKDLAGIKETPEHLQLESNYTGDFEVPFFRKDLLVIEITGYNYPFGAAHGMPVKKYVHLDLKTGEIFYLKDLFKPVSPYVKVLSELIGNQIKNNGKYSYVFPRGYKGIQMDQPFFISEEGLNIYFAPYEIAPFVAGFPTFTLLFEDLTKMIDKNGAFWKSFH